MTVPRKGVAVGVTLGSVFRVRVGLGAGVGFISEEQLIVNSVIIMNIDKVDEISFLVLFTVNMIRIIDRIEICSILRLTHLWKQLMTSVSWYKNFTELSRSEREGISYKLSVKNRRSPFVIVAPHGGGIEPGTSEIAKAIAGFQFSYYTFDGLRQKGNVILHIASTLFDEPKCLQLVNASEVVVAIHGCADEEKVIYVGGLLDELKTRLINTLVQTGFDARLADVNYAGTQIQNICNRGRLGRGVQLEISESLRRTMFKAFDRQGRKIITDVFQKFVVSVHQELCSVAKEMGIRIG